MPVLMLGSARLDDPAKNWKFAVGDVNERLHWDKYMRAYEEAIAATSTRHAPWYVVPADRKWYRNWVLSDVLVRTLEDAADATEIIKVLA